MIAALPWTPPSTAADLERVPVPGSAAALARMAGIEVRVEPVRVVADVARALYHSPEDENEVTREALARLRASVATLAEFQALFDRAQSGGGGIALRYASDRERRASLDRLLEFVQLRLRDTNGQTRVEARSDRAAEARVQLLTAFGVDLATLQSRLNAGEDVHFAVPQETVAVPFTPEFWGRAIFDRSIQPTALVTTILLDRKAALLCHGLMGVDAETLGYLATQPDLVRQLYDQSAAAFAEFAGRLSVRDGRVVIPGGARAVALWEGVLGARVNEPVRFIRALFGAHGGRVAYVYDIIANLDEARRAFALGTWIADDRTADERFSSFVNASVKVDAMWTLDRTPFNRPVHDAAHLLTSIHVRPDGAPAPPSSRRFWRAVFDGAASPDNPARELGDVARDGTIDAAWLVQQLAVPDPRARRTRIEQLAFGQRAFGMLDAAAFPEALVALRAWSTFPALVRTLDRIGIRDVQVYTAAARRAQALSALSGRTAFVSLSQFQGAIAIVARLCQAHALTPVQAGSLIQALSAQSTTDGQYRTAVAAWMHDSLLPALRAGDASREPALLRAAAGLSTNPAPVRLDWEGRVHEVSVARAEFDRLVRVRQRQGGPTLDQVLDLYRVVRDLSAPDVSFDRVSSSASVLKVMASAFSAAGPEDVPLGVDPPRSAPETIAASARDLSRVTSSRDPGEVSRAARSLVDVLDDQLADVLRSITYALDIGDADGRLMAGGNVSRRHDFALADSRVNFSHVRWTEPFQDAPAGERWRVTGALLGLDLAFGPQALRRMSTGAVKAPRIGGNERLTFIRGFALMRADNLGDAAQRSLSAAMKAGSARVDRSAGDRAAFDLLAEEIRMDHWRRNAVHWELATRPDAPRDYFSMVELIALGGGAALSGDPWGSASLSGCWCTSLAPPNMVWAVSGRAQAGMLPAAVPDVHLRVASILAELGVPAELGKGVVAFAVQDLLDRADPVDTHDWMALVRAARALTVERVQDYVAALAVRGPLRLVEASASVTR